MDDPGHGSFSFLNLHLTSVQGCFFAQTIDACWSPRWVAESLAQSAEPCKQFVPAARGFFNCGRRIWNARCAMLVVHVHVHVKPECVEDFKKATAANARESTKEPGIAAFDLAQSKEDPTRFVLVEAYRTEQAPAAHRETRHYQAWRDAVAPMMAEPRTRAEYTSVSPDAL
jgi:autoinducer 2-degrading protein